MLSRQNINIPKSLNWGLWRLSLGLFLILNGCGKTYKEPPASPSTFPTPKEARMDKFQGAGKQDTVGQAKDIKDRQARDAAK